MDTAVHPTTNIPVNVIQISALDPDIRHAVTRTYVCTECRNMAHYRSETRDGKAATLYCRPHVDGCPKASTFEQDESPDEILTEVDKIENSGEILVLDPVPTKSRVFGKATDDSSNDKNITSKVHKLHVGTTRRTDRRHKNIEQLLIDLDNGAFDPSRFTFKVNIPQHLTLPVSEMIVPFSAIDDSHSDTFRVFWGYIASVRSEETRSFLNSGSRGAVGIMLSQPQRTEVATRLGLEYIGQAEGYAVLVRGKVNVKNGARYITFKNAEDVALVRSVKSPQELLDQIARQS
jgi:hypothetical protein